MRLYTGFEEIQRGWTVAFSRHFLTTGVVHLGHLAHEWHHVTQEFHQTANTHTLACTHTEYGEDTARYQALADTFA